MSDIKVDGVIISQAEMNRLIEMEAELHKTRMAKSIVIYVALDKLSIQYNSEEQHITFMGDMAKEVTEKTALLAEQKKVITDLQDKTYTWGWPEYLLVAASLVTTAVLFYKVVLSK